MSNPSRMCWCDDLACRFTDPAYPCPSPRPRHLDEDGRDGQVARQRLLDEKETNVSMWHGRLFTCSPLLSPNR
jgi:hypothetical protein